MAEVEQQLWHPKLFMAVGSGPLRAPNEDDILVAPPAVLNNDLEQRPDAGEEFVVGFERRRLAKAGKPNLAKDVRWVADLDGDGYGYNVKSFELDGEPRLLEIKTTCGNERTPFWITTRECDVAAKQGGIYRIRRVFHFRNEVKMFDIARRWSPGCC